MNGDGQAVNVRRDLACELGQGRWSS